jgi:hypothetical protein
MDAMWTGLKPLVRAGLTVPLVHPDDEVASGERSRREELGFGDGFVLWQLGAVR